MRPYLTQASFEFCGGTEDISEVNALSETNNLHLYLDNWIFDNKNGVWDGENKEQRISEITINSQIYEKLTGEILSALHLDCAKELAIRKEFDRQIVACYKGWKRDLETDVKKASDFKTDEQFFSFYSNRCELLSGCAYGLSAWLGGFIADAPENTLDNLYEFGKLLGTGIHMSNDLGDFGIFDTKATLKSYQDQMADLANSRLTLPIYYVLIHGNENQRNAFRSMAGKGKLTSDEETLALKILMDSGAFDFSYNAIKSQWKKTKNFLHANFAKNESRDKLSAFATTIKTNKYVKVLKDYKRETLCCAA